MAKYTYDDIVAALKFAEFEEEKNNGGSHQKFINPTTGIAVSVPKHSNGVVAPGTAEAILDVAVLCSRICDRNIGSYQSNLSKEVVDYVRKQHQKIKKDFIQLVPPLIRKQNNLETKEDVAKFVQEKVRQARKQYNKRHAKERCFWIYLIKNSPWRTIFVLCNNNYCYSLNNQQN